MIKVGDKFTGIDGREEVVAFIWLYDKTVSVESGLAYSYEEVYKSMYEQQIQRADELEKNLNLINSSQDNLVNELQQALSESNKCADELEERWEKLKEHFIKEKEQSFGMLSWSRNNEALELIERLEEDDNA